MNFKPIFGTGLARSGGGLYSMCLSTHQDLMLACCPNIEFFRSLRNAIVEVGCLNNLFESIPSNSPLQDWHGDINRIKIFNYILGFPGLDIKFDNKNWNEFYSTSVARGELESEDITKNFDKLAGKTYKNILDNLLSVIAETRNCQESKWVGFHETWILDFYPMLARAYPDAKFLIMLRDPRAIVNSMLGIHNIDKTQLVQVTSYIRHWRKYVALANKYLNDPLFKNRLLITTHELLTIDSEVTLKKICDFLQIKFDTKLLDTENFINPATGDVWTGNSSFEKKTEGMKLERVFRWKKMLDEDIILSIEYMCGNELKYIGYPLETSHQNNLIKVDEKVINFLSKDLNSFTNWRSDLGDTLHDIGLELKRKKLLECDDLNINKEIYKKAFLFEDFFNLLKSYNKGAMFPELKSLYEGYND